MFQVLRLVPHERSAKIVEASISFNYTTVLNILFLILAALLLVRFFKTGGPEMLSMMNHPHEHGGHDAPQHHH